MTAVIKRIDIVEKDKRAYATFNDGQKLPMHYASAERVFNLLSQNHCYESTCDREGRETVTVNNQTVKVVKMYKDSLDNI